MPQEKTYTIAFTASMLNAIYANIHNTMTVRDWLPILNEIDRQVMEQDINEAKKEELTQVAEQITDKKVEMENNGSE